MLNGDGGGEVEDGVEGAGGIRGQGVEVRIASSMISAGRRGGGRGRGSCEELEGG